jgi:hypothetical protein
MMVALAWCSGSLSAALSSAGKIRSSERLSESRGGLRYVQATRMSSASAYFDEQRRKQAEAGVHFLLVTLSLCKQRKVTRLKAKQNITNNHLSAHVCPPYRFPAIEQKRAYKKYAPFSD